MSRVRHITWLVVALMALALAPAANASYQQAIRDCATDGALHQHYSQSDIRQAINHLPPDINEYSDCLAVLRGALTGGPPSAAGGPAATSSPQDQSALKAATSGARPPKVAVGAHQISPGTGGLFHLASRTAANKLPQPLLLSLIATAAMCLLAGVIALRHRLPWTRRVALRIFRR